MKYSDLTKFRCLSLLTAFSAVVAGLLGVLSPGIYAHVVSSELLVGAVAQDAVTVLAAILLFGLAAGATDSEDKYHSVMLGLLGYLFYAYGLYVIEQVYNWLYLLYVAVWAGAFWTIVYGAAAVAKEPVRNYTLPDTIRKFSIFVSLVQPLVFYPLWIAALIPLMRTGDRIEYLFSVYIIDMVWIMPAFVIMAWMLYKKSALGYLLAPSLFILGFGIIFSLAVAELLGPLFDSGFDRTDMLVPLGLSLLFLVTAVLHIRKLNVK